MCVCDIVLEKTHSHQNCTVYNSTHSDMGPILWAIGYLWIVMCQAKGNEYKIENKLVYYRSGMLWSAWRQ